jgi:hypothetical protein
MNVFKTPISNLDFFNFLETICLRTDKYFLFDNNAFKKMIYQDSYSEFKTFLESHYHSSKRKYLERELTYNSFTTILRHICKANCISYATQMKYVNSKYNINYYIYFD